MYGSVLPLYQLNFNNIFKIRKWKSLIQMYNYVIFTCMIYYTFCLHLIWKIPEITLRIATAEELKFKCIASFKNTNLLHSKIK